MRRGLLSLILIVALGFCSAGSSPAQGIISQDQAQRAGLVVNWFSQISGVGSGRLVNYSLVIDENQATTFFEITGGRLREVISEKDLGPNGQPYASVEAAEEIAKIRGEVMQARLNFMDDSSEVKINRYSLPKSTIYCISESAVVQALDAESGKTLWQTQIGRSDFPTAGVGAGRKFVVAVNGSSVYCLDSAKGKLLWTKRCETAVMGAPSVSDTSVYVPLADGRLQIFDTLSSGNKTQTMISTGAAFTAPTLNNGFVSWATDKGFLSVAPDGDMNRILYRLRGDSSFVAPATAKGGTLFAASANGFVYAVKQVRGSMVWSSSIGERIVLPPFPLGDYLYVVTEENHLHKFDARDGVIAPGWERCLDGIRMVVGAGRDRIYVQTVAGDLLALDQKTGSRLGLVRTGLSLQPLVNYVTDRIYLCSASGVIECLRETGAAAPYFHGDEFTALIPKKFRAETDSTDPAEKSQSDESDPFGDSEKRAEPPASDDPFADPPAQKPAGDDPFGGDGKKKDSDPFGGGDDKDSDPFGGGGSDKKGGGQDGDPFGGG